MEITQILVDMDGVLVDFAGASCALHGKPGTLIDGPDIAATLGISTNDFWEPIDDLGPGFWSDLPDLPWTEDLLNLVADYGASDRWHIATSPSLCPFSAMGKVIWLQHRLGRGFRRYMIGSQKWLMAKPGHVLIDDNEENIRLFELHGGSGILVPQTWNSNRVFVGQELKYISDRLSGLLSL